MRKYAFYLLIICAVAFASCNKDDDYNLSPDFKLSFSSDTVSFDTLLSGLGSTTKQLKVYNTSSGKINISRVFLHNSSSPYRLNINGVQSNDLTDVELGANDSLYLFIEVALNPLDNDEPRLLEDQLSFEVNGNPQDVELRAWAQDVYRVDENIESSQDWNGDRPYLVENQVWVNRGAILTIYEGATIYFASEAGLHVKGTLSVEGSFENPVYFGSLRLEQAYDNIPGQWDGIYFYEESLQNKLSSFIVENGVNGIVFEGGINENSLELEFGLIQNFTQKGISVSRSDLLAHDLLVHNCGEACLFLEETGEFKIYHASFYNTWDFSPRTGSAINYAANENNSLLLANSIIWGSRTDEIELSGTDNVLIENCLMRLGDSNQTEFSSVLVDCIFNEDPLFADTEKNDFAILADSPCIDRGNSDYSDLYPLDLMGNQRNIDAAPDIGTYEFLEE